MRTLSAIALVAVIGFFGQSAPARAEGLFFSANLEQLEHRFSMDNGDVVAAEGDMSYGGDDWKIHGLFETEYARSQACGKQSSCKGVSLSRSRISGTPMAGSGMIPAPIPHEPMQQPGSVGLRPISSRQMPVCLSPKRGMFLPVWRQRRTS